MTKYLLDSNVFIQAKNFHYRFEFCQAFWDLIIALHHQGKVFSIKKVKDELNRGSDELTDWIEILPSSFWLDENSYTTHYSDIINWADLHQFKPEAFADFSEYERADAWLVSTAVGLTDTVIVTQEARVDKLEKKNIKIPNVADEFGVDCLSIYDFLSATCHNNFTPL